MTTFAISARGRAAVARRAHNPKVIGSIPVLATQEATSHDVALLIVLL